jgi:hypothetical protein
MKRKSLPFFVAITALSLIILCLFFLEGAKHGVPFHICDFWILAKKIHHIHLSTNFGKRIQ